MKRKESISEGKKGAKKSSISVLFYVEEVEVHNPAEERNKENSEEFDIEEQE